MTIKQQRIESVDFTDLPVTLQNELQRFKVGHRSFPNLLKVLANAPIILEAYLAFGEALDISSLSIETREKISLAVSELNSSEYDVAAHTYIAAASDICPEEIEDCRKSRSEKAQDGSLLSFAKNVVRKNGILNDRELETARQFQRKDGQLIEVVATIAYVHFANLINNLAETHLDYPAVREILHENN